MIEIPAGAFILGGDRREANEARQRTVELPAFRITRHEITNREYAAFAKATGHRPAFYQDHPVFGLPDHPAVGVSWDDADAFCRHYGMTLPSEAQWERAARGTEGRLYAWGNEPPTPDRVNRGAEVCCGPDDADGYAATAPVGSKPAGDTPEGIADLTGNVWEWVDAWYDTSDAGPAAREKKFRVLRGGAWNSDGGKLRATYRMAYAGDFRYAANGGFRCAAD